MNTKPLLCLGGLCAITLATSTVNAGPHRGGGNGNHFASRPARSGGVSRSFVGGNRFVGGGNRVGGWNGQHLNRQRFASGQNWNGQHWNGQNWNHQHWNGQHWGNNWNWHHHHHNNFAFVDFGFPFWGWWGNPYSYGYYPYGLSYGYYGSGYYGGYGYNYGNGYGYGNGNGYGNGYSNNYDAKVGELQQRLANAGYYRGEIDGIFGSRTRYALKAYRHDHPNGNDNGSGYHQYPTQRNQPYSPPPVTTEPSPTE